MHENQMARWKNVVLFRTTQVNSSFEIFNESNLFSHYRQQIHSTLFIIIPSSYIDICYVTCLLPFKRKILLTCLKAIVRFAFFFAHVIPFITNTLYFEPTKRKQTGVSIMFL